MEVRVVFFLCFLSALMQKLWTVKHKKNYKIHHHHHHHAQRYIFEKDVLSIMYIQRMLRNHQFAELVSIYHKIWRECIELKHWDFEEGRIETITRSTEPWLSASAWWAGTLLPASNTAVILPNSSGLGFIDDNPDGLCLAQWLPTGLCSNVLKRLATAMGSILK